jgi:tetratricopeptide (TPR) repeat protein
VSGPLCEDEVLSGACGPDLLHLLTCPACRAWAIGRLLDEAGREEDEEETREDYDALFENLLAPSPEAVEAALRRRREAERLLGELMRLPAKRRLRGLREARFRNLDLLDHLLETSHADQLKHPEEAAELARLAFRLALSLGDEEDAPAALSRALDLAANARRLLGDRKEADSLLRRAASFLRDRTERALHCRTAALVRWEEGRTDEAAALLAHAAKLLAADGLEEEVGVCRALLGLLEEEEGRPAAALPELLKSWAALDRDLRPVFALRLGLGLARCLAELDQGERARSVLQEAWRLYAAVEDPGEMLRVYWREARVLACLGEREEARHVLASVGPKLAKEGSLAEAVLVSLDLALTLAEEGRFGEIGKLAAGLPPAFPGASKAEEGLHTLAALAERRDPGLREAAARERAGLLRMLRLGGVPVRSLPFA